MRYHFNLLCSMVLFAACRDGSSANTPVQGGTEVVSESAIPLLSYSTIGQYPHDTSAFTEGLVFHEGRLFESTGHTDELPSSRSLFGPVDLHTGKISPAAELDKDKYFGEGISFLNGKVYQLTYQEKKGFVYDAVTFKRTGEFTPPGQEGWGMTTDGHSLLISDGTSAIYYIDPATFQSTRRMRVTERDVVVDSLNELEYIKGFLYANRYNKDFIYKIDPSNGHVVGRLDCTSLVRAAGNQYPASMELNGIAYDPATDRIFITGKCWPEIYVIRVN